jgi:hypothetical protein
LLVKNNKWIDVSIPKITSVWDTIKYERENGCHREPKRRKKFYYFGAIEETLDERKNSRRTRQRRYNKILVVVCFVYGYMAMAMDIIMFRNKFIDWRSKKKCDG